jgi:hypothetical protein
MSVAVAADISLLSWICHAKNYNCFAHIVHFYLVGMREGGLRKESRKRCRRSARHQHGA